MDEACEKYKLNFALIATPAEGLSGRFINIDNQDMVYKGEIIKRSEIKKANYVSINVNDIFGKEYSSSLIRLK